MKKPAQAAPKAPVHAAPKAPAAREIPCGCERPNCRIRHYGDQVIIAKTPWHRLCVEAELIWNRNQPFRVSRDEHTEMLLWEAKGKPRPA